MRLEVSLRHRFLALKFKKNILNLRRSPPFALWFHKMSLHPQLRPAKRAYAGLGQIMFLNAVYKSNIYFMSHHI